MTLPSRIVKGLPTLLVPVLALMPVGCGGKAPPAFERPPALIVSASSVGRDVPVYLDEIGRCVAREMVTIQPQVSGQILSIQFADGADVHKGDLLITLDPRTYQAELDAAEANVLESRATQDLAGTELNRWKSVSDQRAVTQQDLDTKRNAVQVAEAGVKKWQAAVDAAKLQLEYCSIRSPIDGRAGQRLVDLGNIVTGNQTALLVIQRLDPIYADFTVTENDLTTVQQHMAKGDLKVQVRLPDEPDAPREGTLTFVDNAVQEITGTVKLRATLPNADHHFWPGRFVKVRLVLETLHDAVLVPVTALQQSATGPFVYVVKSDETAELRPVVLGQRQAELTVVQSGLQAGERVVIEGQLGVSPGGKVREAPPPAAPAGPAAAAGTTASSTPGKSAAGAPDKP